MPGKVDIDYETMDLYRQLLWDAQKMEDQRLVKMVRSRIRKNLHRPLAGFGKDNIFLFPHRHAFCLDPEPDLQFWIQSQFWMDMGKLFLILFIIGGWTCLPFIKIIMATMGGGF